MKHKNTEQKNTAKKKATKRAKIIAIGAGISAAVVGGLYIYATKKDVCADKILDNLPKLDMDNDPDFIADTVTTSAGKVFSGHWFDTGTEEYIFYTKKDET